MIGCFLALPKPDNLSICVEMYWGEDLSRQGKIALPEDIEAHLVTLRYPSVSGNVLGLPAALSYALFLALQAGLPLRLTGDLSVWDDSWGELIVQDQHGLHRPSHVGH